MSTQTNKTLLLVLLVVLIALCIPLNNMAGKVRENSQIDMRPGATAALGFDNIVSDILWIELIQYYGDIKGKVSPEIAQKIYERFERITRYDPSFIKAYKYAALLLFEKPEEAVGLIERALEYNKDTGWELPFFAGFISYFQLKDYELAAKFFQISHQYPDRPPHIDRLLAQSKSAAGYEKEALELWAVIYKEAENSTHRSLGAKFLKQLAQKITQESKDEKLRLRAQEILNTL